MLIDLSVFPTMSPISFAVLPDKYSCHIRYSNSDKLPLMTEYSALKLSRSKILTDGSSKSLINKPSSDISANLSPLRLVNLRT